MKLKRVLSMILMLTLSILPIFVNEAKAANTYTIYVDLTSQIVTIYNAGNISESGIVRQMICSTGATDTIDTMTPIGTFSLPSEWNSSERTEWYYFYQYKCYAKWATRITGNILFHSVLFDDMNSNSPTSSSVSALGFPASHGCIRLRVEDAKWIAQNCPAGTTCTIYSSEEYNNTLRDKLLSSTYSCDECPYSEFLYGDAGTLENGSRGQAVKKLQQYLIDLDYLNDTADGIFGPKTQAAVSTFQAACGLSQTGKADSTLRALLYAADAPAANDNVLTIGSSGSSVSQLQAALKTLKLYNGTVSGVYDADTANAVHTYQSAFGMNVNGQANKSVQKAIINKATDIKTQFGDSDYEPTFTELETIYATVKVNSHLNLRKNASSSSNSIAKLSNGTIVTVLEKGTTWSKVQIGSTVGHAHNSYLSFFTVAHTTIAYTPVESSIKPLIELVVEPSVDVSTDSSVEFMPSPATTSEPTATPEN